MLDEYQSAGSEPYCFNVAPPHTFYSSISCPDAGLVRFESAPKAGMSWGGDDAHAVRARRRDPQPNPRLHLGDTPRSVGPS